jgi:hypothetical protein
MTKTVRVTESTDLGALHRSLKADRIDDVEFEFSNDRAAKRLTRWLARQERVNPSSVAV